MRRGLRMQSPIAIEFDARTAYDFVVCISEASSHDVELLPDDRHWLDETLSRLGSPNAASQPDLCDVAVTGEVARLIVAHPDICTARDVVKAVDGLSDRELVDVVLGELLETPELSTLTRRAIDGSAAAASELQAILEQQRGIETLGWQVNAVAPSVREAVHKWLEPFETVEPRVARMQERDVTRRRAMLPETAALDFVEQTTNGIRLVPDSRLRRIVLAPSYFGRPYNNLTRIGDTQLICYPLGDEALDAADRRSPPQAVLRLFRALGDESRLRILRLLSERDWYLTELATELDLSKPTVKHHLAQLRSAGLVTMTEEAGLTVYSLRRERLSEGGAELRAFLAL